jgi:hypothetical protein
MLKRFSFQKWLEKWDKENLKNVWKTYKMRFIKILWLPGWLGGWVALILFHELHKEQISLGGWY